LCHFLYSDGLQHNPRLRAHIHSYWKPFLNQPDTPEGRLADIFLTYFSCPVAEVSCERVFSVMRIILTDHRKKMSLESLFCTIQVKLGLMKKEK
jgi:hypothetical protein